MRYCLPPIFLLLISFSALAQRSLSGSIQHSLYTYVFKINVKEAEQLEKTKLEKVDERYLHTLTDSFLTATDELPRLKEGNYLLVRARNNRLIYQLHTTPGVQAKIINNDHDLTVAVHTAAGAIISQAAVYMNDKKLPYRATLQTYGPVKNKKASLLKVAYNDVLYTFPIEKYKTGKPFFKRISRAFPLKYMLKPFRKPQRRYWHQTFYRRPTTYERKFQSFMVFNKPLYKPGDTVHLKAFIETNKGKFVDRPLLVRICNSYFDTDTIIATIRPYRPGGYEYEFVLNDSLDLDLDEDYLVTLEEVSSRKYDLNEYDGDLDDDEYAAKRKVLARGEFKHEEYELSSISFTARSEKDEHNRGEEIAIYLKAVDENELAVMDGRVEILVRTSDFGSKQFHAKKVFLPDTLWTHSQALEPAGETKIILPDSIFPRASFDYTIECTFLNTNNELQHQTLSQKFRNAPDAIYFEEENDSLKIDYRIGGKSVPVTVTVSLANDKTLIEQQTVTLPAVVKINPFATAYEVESDSLYETYEPEHSKGVVSCLASRSKDSVMVRLVNPQRLPVWYTIFAGNRIVFRGHSDTMLYIGRTRTPEHYFVSLQYIYGNRVHKEDYTIPFHEKLITIRTTGPKFIYPGQTVPIGIHLTDVSGKPVANADVTAYSFTKKFEAGVPNVPYMGRYYPQRGRKAGIPFSEKKALEKEAALNWGKWSREMRLDTIEYYNFLHPDGIYFNQELAPDSLTQIAPFVVHKGDLQPVYMIYIDELPVYFSQSQHLHRYSFRVSEGKHSLRLRTRDHMIYLDSVQLAKGMKTFLSIEADTANKYIRIEKMPDTLTPHEQFAWGRYMILVQNTFGENYSYVKQWQHVFLLNAGNAANKPLILTGPYESYEATLSVKNKYKQDFTPEGSWQFIINKGLIKQRQLLTPAVFPSRLPAMEPAQNFRDLVLTEKEIDSLWQDYLDYRSSNTALFANSIVHRTGNGSLQIGVPRQRGKEAFIKNIILFRYDNADFTSIHTGSTRSFGYLQPGYYRLMLLLKHNNYLIADSLLVRRNGVNYYEIAVVSQRRADSVSNRIAQIIESGSRYRPSGPHSIEAERIKETFNDKFLDPSTFPENIMGVVRDKDGTPIPFVTIRVKGSNIGVRANEMGEFSLRTPQHGYIVVSAMGFEQQELRINGNIYYNIVLTPNESRLNEVVVLGFGATRRREVAASVKTISADQILMGKVAGVAIEGDANAPRSPLLIVDGLPYSGKLEDIDKNDIINTRMIQPKEAVALYGSDAAAGAIIITTKKQQLAQDGQPMPGNTLRRNFRDDAYWQPKLKTDANGYATFKVTFPDDITNWRTFTIAMADKKRSGFLEENIKSFKALSGNINLPLFAVDGDSVNVIGKTLNYLAENVQVKRSFSVNGQLVKENMISLRNSWIDTLAVIAVRGDSLKLKYTVQKEDGYFDGEERVVPVFRPGVMETNGLFMALNRDTSFNVQMKTDTGVIKIYAEASLLPVLYEETESIRNYEYLCNEQLASKLKAMLVQKKIDEYLKRPFKGEANIRDLINRLNKSKSVSGLWGWWAGNTPSVWISLHVVEALAEAQQNGYATALNKTPVIDHLMVKLESYSSTEQISALLLLHKLGATPDYQKHIDTIEHKNKLLSLYERLRLAELRQKLGLAVQIDTFIPKQHRTAFGNVYWGQEGYRFFDNAVQNTLLMYRILRKQGGHNDLLQRTRNYFLEKRKDGNWRNTYESSLILETILPDLLAQDPTLKPARLTISGKQNLSIEKFPYHTELKKGESISVSKEGSMPVYFTAYEQHWNPAPEKLDGNFSVHTSFEQDNKTIALLKAGTPVTLRVNVTVKADADYVMIEIPIPAGCSYLEKSQSYFNNEVHREHFKHKVSIFCSELRQGSYRFTISLLPKFTGVYTLNPAKAEMMYFPVFNGREAMKKIRID